MKKLILSFVLALTSFGAFSQNNLHNVITNSISTQRMVWSDIDDEWLFFDLEEEHLEYYSWLVNFNDNHTGTIKITGVKNQKIYDLIIYNWEIRQDEDEKDYIWMDIMQTFNSEKGTIMLNEYPNGKFISVFLPDSQLAIFFSNLEE